MKLIPSYRAAIATKYLRGVRRYAAPLGKQPKEILNEKGYPERLRGFPIDIATDPNMSAENQIELERRLESYFGPEIFHPENLKKLAKASGAIPGSNVVLGLGHSRGVSVSHQHQIPGLLRAERTFYRDENGKLVKSANIQETHASIQGGGAKRFNETLTHLRDLGVDKIKTHAVGHNNGEANGYYTWPRFGFNANLSDSQVSKLPEHIRQELRRRGKQDLHTLLNIPGAKHKDSPEAAENPDHTLGGAGAWMRHGSAIKAEFDLHPDSPHSQKFQEYYSGKTQPSTQNSQPGTTPNGMERVPGASVPLESTGGIVPFPGQQSQSGTGNLPSRASTSGGTPPKNQSGGVTKPNKPMARHIGAADVKHNYAAKRDTTAYTPLIQHAAAVLHNPQDNTAYHALADHLQEAHPDHPVVQAFTRWVTGDPEAWPTLRDRMHPVNAPEMKGWEGRGTTLPQGTRINERSTLTHPVDLHLYGYAQRPEQLERIQRRHPEVSADTPISGFVRNYENPYWQRAVYRERGHRQFGQRGWHPQGPRLSHLQVANHVYNNNGVTGLIHLLMSHRFFHPETVARQQAEEGGHDAGNARFSRKSDKVRCYAKVDGHEPAHHLVQGFPIEHALRHLANDPGNTSDVRNLSKAALTGKDLEGKDIAGGPTSALWGLHDALQESSHPAAGWYRWLNAADKLHEDHMMHTALSHVANEQKVANPYGYAREDLHSYSPESIAIRVRNGHKELKDRVLEHYRSMLPTKRFEGVSDLKRANESLLRHVGRAVYLSAAKLTPTAEGHFKQAALTDGKGGVFHVDVDKASRYAKKGKAKKRFAMIDTLKSYHFPEEQAHLDKPAVRDEYLGHVERALNNEPGTIPTLRETKALATHGQPAKGGYRNANDLVSGLLRNPLDAQRFAEATAILSPNAGWLEHTRGALEGLAHWHEAGRPSDDASLSRIFGDIHKDPKTGAPAKDPKVPSLLNFTGYFGSKPRKMKELFAIPDEQYAGIRQGGWKRMVAGDALKVPNFGLAHVDPLGKPVDTHMAKLFVPEHLHEMMHSAGFDLSNPAYRGMTDTILAAQKKLATNPAAVLAYGTLISHAAGELGWEPREVQEAVWVATLAAMAAKSRGASNARDVIHTFSQHALRQGWDMRPVLTDPGLVKLLHRTYGVSEGDIYDALSDSERKRPLEAGGRGRTSDLPAYSTAVARLPARSQAGAAGIVNAHNTAASNRLATALRTRQQGTSVRKQQRKTTPLKNGTISVRKYALNPNDNFLDALRSISASNNLAPIAKNLAAKMGAPDVFAAPALHNTPKGSVPGVALALYGRQDPSAVHYLAGQIALMNGRKNKAMAHPGVTVFHVRPGGPDSVHKFYQEGSGLDIMEKLNRAGITNRVLSPHHKGFNVMVPDKGGAQYMTVKRYSQTHNVPLQSSKGYLKNVGSTDGAQARDTFRNAVVKGQGGSRQMARSRPVTPAEGEEPAPGSTTADGGKYEPEKEPDLGEFIANQFSDEYGPTDSEITPATGFLLESGETVPMGHGERADDHRGAIPTGEAMQRWGWPADVIRHYNESTRTPALMELMKRAKAVRIHAGGGQLIVHHNHPMNYNQRKAILDHVRRYKPDYVLVSDVMRNQEHELDNPTVGHVARLLEQHLM